MNSLKTSLFSSVAALCLSLSGHAALTAVFEYSFPDSFDGTNTTITDLSGAGNNGTMDTLNGYLAGDRPPGFLTGGSLTGATGGHGATNAIDLLQNSTLEANGGFTMDVWFRWDGTQVNVRKLIDYAGTEFLRTNGGQIQFVLSNGATVLAEDIVGGQWYHVVAEFDTLGNSVDGSGNIAGEARLYLDGSLVDSSAATKTAQGDNLNRPIGINRWAGGGADWNQGAIYNPSVYLGVIPEPSSSLLIGVAGVGFILRRRR